MKRVLQFQGDSGTEKWKSFSLIELLAIILILAAIAIPNLLRSYIAAREGF